jgi:arabinofuranosyltransferase
MGSLNVFLRNHYFAITLIAFLIYSSFLIFRHSFVIEGVRYFSLLDDEMISMRYAYNLANGHGLVWNPGQEPVEGFSNPLWTLYMALIHTLPIPIEKISIVLQVSSTIALMATLYYVKKIVSLLTNRSRFAIAVAITFTAFYFPLNNWSTVQGTEVSILTLLLAISTYLVIKALQGPLSLWLLVFLALGVLVRLDSHYQPWPIY